MTSYSYGYINSSTFNPTSPGYTFKPEIMGTCYTNGTIYLISGYHPYSGPSGYGATQVFRSWDGVNYYGMGGNELAQWSHGTTDEWVYPKIYSKDGTNIIMVAVYGYNSGGSYYCTLIKGESSDGGSTWSNYVETTNTDIYDYDTGYDNQVVDIKYNSADSKYYILYTTRGGTRLRLIETTFGTNSFTAHYPSSPGYYDIGIKQLTQPGYIDDGKYYFFTIIPRKMYYIDLTSYSKTYVERVLFKSVAKPFYGGLILDNDTIFFISYHNSYFKKAGGSWHRFMPSNSSTMEYYPNLDKSNNGLKYLTMKDGTEYNVYKIYEGGYGIKIPQDSTITSVRPFFDDKFYNAKYEKTDVTIIDGSIQIKRYEDPKIEFLTDSDLFSRGEGIFLYNSASDLIYEGIVKEVQSDLGIYDVIAEFPVHNDYLSEIYEIFTGKTISEMFATILPKYCNILYGTVTSSSTTYNIKFDKTSVIDFIKWAEKEEGKFYGIKHDGEVIFDGTTNYGTYDNDSTECSDFVPKNLITTYNGVIIRGGQKENGEIATLKYIEGSNSNTINLFVVNAPNLSDDTESAGHEMYDLAKQIISDQNNSNTRIDLEIYNETKPITPGYTVTISNSTRSITSQAQIVFETNYSLSSKVNTLATYKYLYYHTKVESKEDMPRNNRDLIGQLSNRHGGNEYDSKEPTGYPNRTDSEISISSGIFTIAPTGDEYTIKVNGTSIVKTSSETVDLTGYSSGHLIFVYFDSDGVLQRSATAWEFGNNQIFTAIVYKTLDYSGSDVYILEDERHGFMPWQVHEELHNTIGMVYDSGNGGLDCTFTSTGFSNTAGSVYDEDIRFDIAASSASTAEVVYRDSSGYWRFSGSLTTPYYESGGTLQYNPSGTSLSSVTNNKYIVNIVCQSNIDGNPFLVIMGQDEYKKIEDARAGATLDNYTLTGLPTLEIKPLYFVIYKNAAGTTTYQEAIDIRHGTQLTGGTAATISHNALIDRDAASCHPIQSIDIDNEIYLESGWGATELNDAISTLGALGGGIIHLPSGTTTLTSQIDINQRNITIRGAGHDVDNGTTIINNYSSGYVFLISARYCNLEDLAFSGTSTYPNFVKISSSYNYGKIKNIFFYRDYSRSTDNQPALYIYQSYNNEVIDCEFYGGGIGIKVEETSSADFNTIITNNMFLNLDYCVWLYYADRNIVSSNTVKDCNHFAALNGAGKNLISGNAGNIYTGGNQGYMDATSDYNLYTANNFYSSTLISNSGTGNSITNNL